MTLDSQAQAVLQDLYQEFEELSELFVFSPEYNQLQVYCLIKVGLISNIDASTLSGWDLFVHWQSFFVRCCFNMKI